MRNLSIIGHIWIQIIDYIIDYYENNILQSDGTIKNIGKDETKEGKEAEEVRAIAKRLKNINKRIPRYTHTNESRGTGFWERKEENPI